MVRRADNHRIDVLARQDLVVVARRKNIVAPDLLAARQSSVVAVRHGHQLHARHLHGGPRIPHALPARADQGDLDVIVGRNTFRRLVLHQQRMNPVARYCHWPEQRSSATPPKSLPPL